MAAYATAAQMMARYDVRVIGDLVSDDGTRVASDSLGANANLAAILLDASGRVEVALLRGGRYTVAQLESLSGNAGSYLVRLTCDVAIGMLYERRPWADSEQRGDALKRSREALEQLASGDDIFGVDGEATGTLPSIGGPSTVELDQLNTVVGRSRGAFYPGWRLPNNR